MLAATVAAAVAAAVVATKSAAAIAAISAAATAAISAAASTITAAGPAAIAAAARLHIHITRLLEDCSRRIQPINIERRGLFRRYFNMGCLSSHRHVVHV